MGVKFLCGPAFVCLGFSWIQRRKTAKKREVNFKSSSAAEMGNKLKSLRSSSSFVSAPEPPSPDRYQHWHFHSHHRRRNVRTLASCEIAIDFDRIHIERCNWTGCDGWKIHCESLMVPQKFRFYFLLFKSARLRERQSRSKLCAWSGNRSIDIGIQAPSIECIDELGMLAMYSYATTWVCFPPDAPA